MITIIVSTAVIMSMGIAYLYYSKQAIKAREQRIKERKDFIKILTQSVSNIPNFSLVGLGSDIVNEIEVGEAIRSIKMSADVKIKVYQ